MWMEAESLPLGMQNGNHARLRTQPIFVMSKGSYDAPSGFEQNIIYHFGLE